MDMSARQGARGLRAMSTESAGRSEIARADINMPLVTLRDRRAAVSFTGRKEFNVPGHVLKPQVGRVGLEPTVDGL
jgi:hypothetical protein